jgi:hypothetical protein
MPLAIELDGVADLFGDLQPNLLPWVIVIAVMLALMLAGSLWLHLCRSPAERIVHKRFG